MSYASAFRRVASDVALRITDSGYRHRQAELARLRSLPRYQPTVSNLIGIPLDIVDDRPVDFLKLDVEGAETEVLADCADLLGRVENLFVEYHSFGDEPQSIHTLLSVMQGAGFRVHVRASTGSPQPFLFRALNLGMDNQLCVYAFRAEQNVAAGPRLCE